VSGGRCANPRAWVPLAIAAERSTAAYARADRLARSAAAGYRAADRCAARGSHALAAQYCADADADARESAAIASGEPL